jgi:hypothetical protein
VENLDDIKKDVQGNEEQNLKPLDATKCFHSCRLGLEPAHGLYLKISNGKRTEIHEVIPKP